MSSGYGDSGKIEKNKALLTNTNKSIRHLLPLTKEEQYERFL
jgi:hypothetical protein